MSIHGSQNFLEIVIEGRIYHTLRKANFILCKQVVGFPETYQERAKILIL